MTTAITRWSFRLLVCLVVTGCSSMPLLNSPATEEADLFARGLDQYLASGELSTLALVPEKYPQGEWRTRADGVIALAEKQQQQHVLLQKKEKQTNRCQAERDALVKDNQILEETLERLKQVLIDMELRGK